MALDHSNSSNLEQLAMKGFIFAHFNFTVYSTDKRHRTNNEEKNIHTEAVYLRVTARRYAKRGIGLCNDLATVHCLLHSCTCVFLVFAHRCSIAKSVGWFQRRLFVCLCVCQHDNFRTSKYRMMKLGGSCIVQKYRPSSNLGVIAVPGCAPPKLWRCATTLGKSAQVV